MKGKSWWGLALVLALLAGGLPVAAQGKVMPQVVEEAGCLASIQPLGSGVVQIWIYCEEDGYLPAGTALHLVAAPGDWPLQEPWTLTDLSAFPGGLLTGEYWLRQNAIAPAAVLIRALGPEKASGRLLRLITRARVQRAESAVENVAGSGLSLAARQETTTRSGQGSGAGEQQHTLTQTRQRSELHASDSAAPVQLQAEQQVQVQNQARQGGGNGRGQGR